MPPVPRRMQSTSLTLKPQLLYGLIRKPQMLVRQARGKAPTRRFVEKAHLD